MSRNSGKEGVTLLTARISIGDTSAEILGVAFATILFRAAVDVGELLELGGARVTRGWGITDNKDFGIKPMAFISCTGIAGDDGTGAGEVAPTVGAGPGVCIGISIPGVPIIVGFSASATGWGGGGGTALA